jgi:hypothetical protein
MQDNILFGNASSISWNHFHALHVFKPNRHWWSLIRHTIANNMPMLRFLIDIGIKIEKRKIGDDSLEVFTCSRWDYSLVAHLGRTENLEHLIAATGASIPLKNWLTPLV